MTENESLRSIAERLGLTLRVSADGSEIVIRRAGKEPADPPTPGAGFHWPPGRVRCPVAFSFVGKGLTPSRA